MKQQIFIIASSIFLILVISLFILNLSLTGFAIYNNSSSRNITQENNLTSITKEDALFAINESENIMNEMEANGFKVILLNDTLIKAKKIFYQVQYAAILRGEVNASAIEKTKATSALRLIDWKNMYYSDVLIYTEEIKAIEQKAFLVLDKLAVEENKINQSTDAAKIILEQAKQAFLDERYNDAEKLLEDFRIQFEKDKANASLLAGLKNGAFNFFWRYWIQIIIFLVIVSFIGYYVYKIFEKRILQNKIKKMKIQEQVLNDLMKKAQTQRFKDNKISGLVYNIRFKKYQEKLQTIKEEMPVLEDNLKKLSGRREWKR